MRTCWDIGAKYNPIQWILYYHCSMHITKTSRDTYKFSSDFFNPDGRVDFDSFADARMFAAQMTAHRTQPVPASDLYALSLIDEAINQMAEIRDNEIGSGIEIR